jgi:hypothetical protein
VSPVLGTAVKLLKLVAAGVDIIEKHGIVRRWNSWQSYIKRSKLPGEMATMV